jgi:hypothetical protein
MYLVVWDRTMKTIVWTGHLVQIPERGYVTQNTQDPSSKMYELSSSRHRDTSHDMSGFEVVNGFHDVASIGNEKF